MENFTRIEYQGQPVLSYKQVAVGLKCSSDLLRHLYRHHKEEFQEGVHFFKLEGSALRALKKEMNNLHVHSFARGAKSLFLWTKQGVARLSKLIDTPEAWALFGAMEQSYFDNQEVVAPVQQSLPLPVEPVVVAETDKACVYVFLLSSKTVKIGVTSDLVERARAVERSCGFPVIGIHTSELLPKADALKVEKLLHEKFGLSRLEGEFFNVSFKSARRELERTIAELHLFEPLALPDVNLAEKLVAFADKLDPSPERQKMIIHAANLLVGQNIF